MSADSSIEWTDKTWNPVVGCTKVSPGCKNCYAKTLHDQRHKAHAAGKKMPAQYAEPFEVVQLMPDRLTDPLSWRKPQKVFVNSVSDLFHDDVPDEFIERVFAVMFLAKRHTFQVLTKRPERMAAFLSHHNRPGLTQVIAHTIDAKPGGDREDIADWYLAHLMERPLPNVWLGTSVENQAAADERIPHLLRTPAAVRFLSCEPLLGPVNVEEILVPFGDTKAVICPLTGEWAPNEPSPVNGATLDWIIVGGESGTGARPCNVDDIRSLVAQCRKAGTAVFVKQLGANVVDECEYCTPETTGWPAEGGPINWNTGAVSLRDKKGGDPTEWPSDIRIREFPTPTRGAA